jgi:hypothetical protein
MYWRRLVADTTVRGFCINKHQNQLHLTVFESSKTGYGNKLQHSWSRIKTVPLISITGNHITYTHFTFAQSTGRCYCIP